MKHLVIRSLAVAALAAGTIFAQSTPAPAPGQARPGRMMQRNIRQRVMQALNLTDAQKQQAKTIFQAARQNAQPVVQQLKQNRQAMAAAVKANDTAQIQSLASAQGNLQGQVTAIRAESRAKFYSILTPDQKTKADQIQQRIQQRLQQRLGKASTNG